MGVASNRLTLLLCGMAWVWFVGAARANQLPEDSVDAALHTYSGEGVDVISPAFFMRKSFKKDFSVEAGLRVDDVTNASVDTELQASEWSEQRSEVSLNLDYLHEDALISGGIFFGSESDYDSLMTQFSIRQQFFEGMSQLTMGYARSYDDIGRADSAFSAQMDQHQFNLSLRQILTADWLAVLTYEVITEKGYLGNPYRLAARSCTQLLFARCQLVNEVYPTSHLSRAYRLHSRYYLGLDFALINTFHFYNDTWDVSANEVEIGLAGIVGGLSIELGYRIYQQNEANFYFDNAQGDTPFLSRDKELAAFDLRGFRIGAGYEIPLPAQLELENFMIHLVYEFSARDFDNYTDLRDGTAFSEDSSLLQITFGANF